MHYLKDQEIYLNLYILYKCWLNACLGMNTLLI